ncbi:MAG: pantetheine-phosphate adenylyltransferase [Brevinematia bacterium]
MEKVVVYPGTFDPITNGHLDIALRASSLFDKVIVALPKATLHKSTFFTFEERFEILKEVFKDNPKFEVVGFEGLLVDFVKRIGAVAIVRGLRAVSDFEYELQIALMNMHLCGVETIFFMTSEENMFVSSSVIKEIALLGGDISSKVPPIVVEKIKSKVKTSK